MRLAGPFAGLAVVVLALSTLVFSSRSGHAVGPFTMSTAVQLPTSDGGTEPRYTVVSVGAHPGHYAISNVGGTATVWESNDGVTGWHVTGAIANQTLPTIDVDLVSMPADSTHPGRLIANELDTGGLNIRTSYSDDGGVAWTQSTLLSAPMTNGTQYVDQDRNWLAAGPHDHAYFLFHNLASGAVTHNMYVSTSTDGGATFSAPIPTTAPSSQAFTDLQCADSGGPSNIFVNQQNGRVYAVWGSRSSNVAGGCGSSVTGSFEINVVAATRVWVSTAPQETGPATGTMNPAAWQQSLAVDDNPAAKIVGMQLGPGAIDSAGNLYVVYPESTAPYPNYDGAAIKYVHATEADVVNNPYGTGLPNPPPNKWSMPVTVAPSGGAGHLLPHIVAGGPGQIDMAYFEGDEIAGKTPPTTANWFLVVAQTTDALNPDPNAAAASISHFRVNYPGAAAAPLPAYGNFTASQMMGACGQGPASGFTCNRSTDVWGIALDKLGNLQVTWPSASSGFFGCSNTVTTPPTCTSWVSAQIDGPTIAPPTPNDNVPETPWVPLALVLGAAVAGGALRFTRKRKEL
jgi:hypothetical protein